MADKPGRGYIFRSQRLGFRLFEQHDLEPLSAINTDSKVMEFFPSVMAPNETKEMLARIKAHHDKHGFGLYAVDTLENYNFIGFIGFMIPRFKAHFTPCIEIAYRIKYTAWNKGYATEGAARCLQFGFNKLGFSEVHSYTSLINKRSERIMQKIGMKKLGYFEHPLLPAGNPLKKHVIYSLSKKDIETAF